MRSLAKALTLFCICAVSVNCQTRLGLVSSQLGVAPVPGGQAVPTNPNSPSCFCLPPNQRCPLVPPSELLRNDVDRTRPIGGKCPDPEQKLCCPRGSSTGIPGGPIRPDPVVPTPVQLGTCGVSNPLPYRPSVFPEADFSEYPWMALVVDLGNRYLGGGVLISPEWVLTAAHKVATSQSMKVRLGEHDVQSPQDHPGLPHLEVAVDNIIIHPSYDSVRLSNDVALLHLAQPVNTQRLPHIGTACLPQQGQQFFGQTCWVTGWGQNAFDEVGSFQRILKEVDVPVVRPNDCQARLRRSRLGPNFILDRNSFLCAGGEEGKDACTGDGGAPLVCLTNRGWTVAGLVAWGIGCATNQLPGVYVNVANYADFISQYVRA